MTQDDEHTRRLLDDLRRENMSSQTASIIAMEVVKSEVAILKIQILAFEKALLERVQKLEFIPVKLIAYALAGGTLTTVFGAVIAKVIIK